MLEAAQVSVVAIHYLILTLRNQKLSWLVAAFHITFALYAYFVFPKYWFATGINVMLLLMSFLYHVWEGKDFISFVTKNYLQI